MRQQSLHTYWGMQSPHGAVLPRSATKHNQFRCGKFEKHRQSTRILPFFYLRFFCGQFLFLQNSTMMKCRWKTSWDGHGQTGKQLGFQIYSWKCPAMLAKLHIVAISYCQLAESSLLLNCLWIRFAMETSCIIAEQYKLHLSQLR